MHGSPANKVHWTWVKTGGNNLTFQEKLSGVYHWQYWEFLDFLTQLFLSRITHWWREGVCHCCIFSALSVRLSPSLWRPGWLKSWTLRNFWGRRLNSQSRVRLSIFYIHDSKLVVVGSTVTMKSIALGLKFCETVGEARGNFLIRVSCHWPFLPGMQQTWWFLQDAFISSSTLQFFLQCPNFCQHFFSP